jgi:hypothetical protein
MDKDEVKLITQNIILNSKFIYWEAGLDQGFGLALDLVLKQVHLGHSKSRDHFGAKTVDPVLVRVSTFQDLMVEAGNTN